MAGILAFWPGAAKKEYDPGKWRESVAIITRDAHIAVGDVHERQPNLLDSDAYDDWPGDHLGMDALLNCESEERAASLAN